MFSSISVEFDGEILIHKFALSLVEKLLDNGVDVS